MRSVQQECAAVLSVLQSIGGASKSCRQGRRKRAVLVRALGVAGYNILGRGFFSVVVSSPAHPGIAFKVGAGLDTGYEYARWCRSRHTAGVQYARHLPEVLGLAVRDGGYVVGMPMYSKHPRSMDHWTRNIRYVLYGDPVSTDVPTLDRAILAVAAEFSDWQFDMHHGNWMLDAAGCIVITDPTSMRRGESF